MSHLEAFPSIFPIFLHSLQPWALIASRYRIKRSSSFFMLSLPLLLVHSAEPLVHGSIVAISVLLPMLLLASDVWCSSCSYASGSVLRFPVLNAFLPNASPNWSSATHV